MSDDATRLEEAKQLVNQQKYQQARRILVTMPDNPKAQKWLKQLDQRFPEAGQNSEESQLEQAKAYIDTQRYDEAIRILRGLPHNETAQKWLDRLQNLDRTTEGDAVMSNESIPPTPDNDRSATDYKIPMAPPVMDALKTNLFDRLGTLGGLSALGAILFAVAFTVEIILELDSDFVYGIIAAILTAVVFYGLAIGLSIAYPKMPRNTLFAFIGIPVVVTLIAGILGLRGIGSFTAFDSQFLEWIIRLIYAVGLAYVFSNGSRIASAQGEPRLNRNLFILLAITLIMFSAGGTRIFFLFSAGLDLPDFLTGLIGGLIYGAMFGAVFAIALGESDASPTT
jgi:hypothetical protein